MIFDIDKKEKSSLAAIDDSGSMITYGELCEFSNKFSQFIPKRAFLFLLSENVIASLNGYIAALENKVVPLLVSASTESNLLENLFSTYQPEYVWLPTRLKENYDGELLFEYNDYSLIKLKSKLHNLYNDLALLLPTSGSTGSSKLVRHSYRNIEANARNVAIFFELNEQERPLAILPMHYTMGLSVISSHIYAGATLLLVNSSMLDPNFWKFLKEQEATSITGVPYSFDILKKMRFTRMQLPHLNVLSQGGGKMTDDNFQFFAQYAKDNGKKFIATYGQTECTARMAYLPADLALNKIGSIGRAIPNGELYIVDDNNNPILEQEATGQLVYKGENVTLGYAYGPEDFQKGDENNGVMFTGDIARRDKDGCHFIVGRKARFLKLFGYRVGLDECELIIRETLNIECACVGNDDSMNIYITSELHKKNVKELLVKKTNLVASVFNIVVVDMIPKNEAGKIMYSKLK